METSKALEYISKTKRWYHYIYGELVVGSVDEDGKYVNLEPSENNEFYKKFLKDKKLKFSIDSFETSEDKSFVGKILTPYPEKIVKEFADSPEASYFEKGGSGSQRPSCLGWGDFGDMEILEDNASEKGKKKLKLYKNPSNSKDSTRLPLLFYIVSLSDLKTFISISQDAKTDETNPFFFSDLDLPKKVTANDQRVWIERKISLNPIYFEGLFNGKSLLDARIEILNKEGRNEEAASVKKALQTIREIAKSFK